MPESGDIPNGLAPLKGPNPPMKSPLDKGSNATGARARKKKAYARKKKANAAKQNRAGVQKASKPNSVCCIIRFPTSTNKLARAWNEARLTNFRHNY